MHKKPIQFLFHSVSIILVAQLLALLIGFLTFYPWQKLLVMDMPASGMAHAVRAARFCFREEPKDILLLGSSLILRPSETATTEGPYPAEKFSDNELDKMLNCDSYQNEIQKAIGRQLKIATLGVPAAMMSDQYLITKALIETGRRPNLIIVSLSARDFIDNTISSRVDDTPVSRVFSAMSSQNLDLLNVAPEKIATRLTYLKKCCELLRLYTRRRAVEWTCKKLGKQESLWYALQERNGRKTNGVTRLVSVEGLSPLVQSLNDYKSRYCPFDKKAYLLQIDRLENILSICSTNKVAVIMVEMPITRENMQLLAPSTRKDLQEQLRNLSLKYKTSLINMNDNQDFHYESSLFSDSVHLRKEGSQKFIADVTSRLVQDKCFKRAFINKLTPPAEGSYSN